MTDELIPAIGYIRVSTWYEEKISDEIQKGAIEEWARRKRRRIVRWVVDLDMTGRNFRRKVMEAIKGIEGGEAHEIACWKYSRFGRNTLGVQINLARVEKAGGQLQSATEDLDASTATGRFTRNMLIDIASFESDRAGEQWKETHEYRRTKGLPATGGKRFGYVWTPRLSPDGQLQIEGYDPDPTTSPVLVDLYKRYVAGEGFTRLAARLNGLGYMNMRGERWTPNVVARVLDSGFGAGLIYVHSKDVRCGDATKCQLRLTHYGHLPGAQPAVLSDELWDTYRERRAQRHQTPPRSRIAKYPLSSMVRCGQCNGSAVTTGKSTPERHSYRCMGRATQRTDCPGVYVRRVAAEAAVYEELAKYAGEIDALMAGSEIDLRTSSQEGGQDNRKLIIAELEKITRGLDRAADMYADADIDREEFIRLRTRYRGLKAAAQLRLDEFDASNGGVPNLKLARTRDIVMMLLEEWDVIAPARARDLLADLGTVVTVDHREVPQARVRFAWQ